MPVTFIIGRAGSGKTTRCLDRIAAAATAQPLGPPIWLVVPKQATFENERALLARLGAFARIRVVHPELLGEAVLSETGGVAVPLVTAAGRRMIIGRLLYRFHDRLAFFASSARRPGLAGAIDELFDEFERSGQTLDQLGDLIDQLGHARPESGAATLHAKLADLRLLYTEYASYVGQDRLDPHRRREQILKRLAESDLLRHAEVYVDGFYEFTESERRMLATIAAGPARVEINLTLDPKSPVIAHASALPDELSPFHRVEQSYVRLHRAMTEAGAQVTTPVILAAAKRFENECLARVERQLFAETVPPVPSPAESVAHHSDAESPLSDRAASPNGLAIGMASYTSAGEGTGGTVAHHSNAESNPAADSQHRNDELRTPLTFLEAPDVATEVQSVARRVRDLLIAGYRQREILVLARKLDDYLHLIHTASDEHGLTYFADRRRPATHHPLVRMLRAAVRIARDGFTASGITSLTKSGLAGLTQAESDRLENYLVEHRIVDEAWRTADAWAFAVRVSSATEDEFDVPPPPLPDGGRDVNALRDHLRERLLPLVDRLGRAARAAPLKVLATELLATLERFQVRQALARWIEQDRAANPEHAEEHEQVWRQLVELFEQMVDVLGDQPMSPGEFVEVLESGLDAFELAITPPTLDQVLVGGVDRTRPPSTIKAVFVLGLSRGVFPPTHREDSLLSSPERRELQRHRIDVDPDMTRRQLDERFLAYMAFTRGSQKLIVSRPTADDAGREFEPSEFWSALRAVVPDAPVVSERGCTGEDPSCLSTPRDVVGSLLDWARGRMEGGRGEGEKGRGGDREKRELAPASTTTAPISAARDDASDWRWSLYDWIARRPLDAGAEVDRLVRHAWPSLCYGNSAKLSPAMARTLFPSPLVVSAGQLESFAACPFQHFISHGLRLAARGGGDVSALDLSRVYHDTLEALVDRALKSKQEFAALPHEQLVQMAREIAPRIAEKIRGEVFLDEARNVYLIDRVGRTLEMILGTVREQLARGVFAPFRAGASFGPSAKLKSPEIPLPGGAVAHLRGKIDRVDCAADGSLAVYDYRMGDQRLAASDVFYGLSLRLLACVLVLDRAKLTYHGKQLIPAAGLCARLLRSLQKVESPERALDPASPEFRLSAKPRGVVRMTHVAHFDKETTTGPSPVLAFLIKQDGSFGRPKDSDVLDPNDFQTLVDFCHQKITDLAGQIVAGRVAVEPYLYHDTTPCVRCDYRSICRFEPTINRYRKLEPLPRPVAIERMRAAVRKEQS